MKHLFFLLSFFIFFSASFSREGEHLRDEDRVRIAEALKIAEQFGNKLWNNRGGAPFAILLVMDENEILINHPRPSDNFKFIKYDSLLRSKIYSRSGVFEKRLLAAFPAVAGLTTIVAGTPENTGKSSSEWVFSILHEHFHQLQMADSSYYTEIKKLGLSGGDSTGMWMLNYPFPYDNSEINRQYKILKEALLNLLKPFPRDSRFFNRNLDFFLKERKKFKELLGEKDYSYFSFQLWQEGIARYTEYKLADMTAHYEPSEGFRSLDDYSPFYNIAHNMRENIFDQVENWELKDKKRACFYSYGAAEGLLLDMINKEWKVRYFTDKFFLEKYFED